MKTKNLFIQSGKLIGFTFLLTLLFSNSIAQNAAYEKGMKKGMELMASAKTPEDHMNAYNHFDRIAASEKSNWIPNYWASYELLQSGLFEENVEKKTKIYDDLLPKVEALLLMNGDRSEVLVLHAFALSTQIAIDPMRYGQKNSMATMAALAEAKGINPNNPRIYVVQGQNAFYTPEAYGGGKDIAKPLFQKAQELYKTDQSSIAFFPNWGKGNCEYFLQKY